MKYQNEMRVRGKNFFALFYYFYTIRTEEKKICDFPVLLMKKRGRNFLYILSMPKIEASLLGKYFAHFELQTYVEHFNDSSSSPREAFGSLLFAF